MKIVYTQGCTCYGLNIDNKDSNEFTNDQLKRIYLDTLSKVIDKKPDLAETFYQNAIIELAESYGECEYQFHCDECGDDVYDFTINI